MRISSVVASVVGAECRASACDEGASVVIRFNAQSGCRQAGPATGQRTDETNQDGEIERAGVSRYHTIPIAVAGNVLTIAEGIQPGWNDRRGERATAGDRGGI